MLWWKIVAGASLVCVIAVFLDALLYSPICPRPLPFPTSSFPTNNVIQGVERLGEGRLLGPEAVCVDGKEGVLYTATRDGWVRRMRLPDGEWEDWQLVGGDTLLGITISTTGGLLVCDATKGLLMVGENEIRTLATEVAGTKISFADDVVEALDGTIYFSDASNNFGLHNWVYDFLEAKSNGRLLKFDPWMNETSIVLADLAFPNGVTMSADQHFVVVCESWKFRCLKHWLKGDRKGRTEILIDNLPGAPDNVNLAPDGSFWIALLQVTPKGLEWIHNSVMVKRVIALFPRIVDMMMKPLGRRAMIVHVTADGEITRFLDDSDGRVMSFITSAVEYKGHLYIGSLATTFVGKLPLNISTSS